MFGIESVTPAPTGVDTAYFHPSVTRDINAEYAADLVFVGSMDYMANVDGVSYFVREILPLIQRRRPGTTFTIVGRKPPAQILAMASDPLIHVTGSVPDVRPYLWNSSISIVPLRVGGGTRLKIYESMAAGAAVVSTTIGAEGLAYEAGRNIEIADGAEGFAKTCVDVLEDAGRRQAIADAGLHMVRERFSWESVTQEFAGILESCRLS
jgi:glycosyltransferase involved in cell wall biosynthesis